MAKRDGSNSVGKSTLYSSFLFDSTTALQRCPRAIEPSLGVPSLIALHDGCAIHDTRIGVSLPVRQHGMLIMCNIYKVLDSKLVCVARMQEADAKAYCERHPGCVYDADIPF